MIEMHETYFSNQRSKGGEAPREILVSYKYKLQKQIQNQVLFLLTCELN